MLLCGIAANSDHIKMRHLEMVFKMPQKYTIEYLLFSETECSYYIATGAHEACKV